MSISDTRNAQKYASIAEAAAAQAKISATELENAPQYAQQAAASATAAASSAQAAISAEATVQSLSNSASQSASQAAVSASQASSAADSAIGRTIRAPEGEQLSALPSASDRASKVPLFSGDGSLEVKALAEFAVLDSAGKIPVSVIPAIALTEPFVANSQAAMLALDAQVGDICKRTDLGYSFCLASSPASTLANWIQLTDDVLAQLGQKTGAAQVGAADDGNNPTTVQAALNNKVSLATLSQSTGAASVGYTSGTVASQLDTLSQFQSNITSGSGVNYVGGAAKQSDLSAVQANVNSIAYIENYSSLVVDGDWSDAIQAAFNTGKVVAGISGKTYKVTKIINSNGQPFLGKLKLQLARTTIPNATFETEYSKASESGFFRGIYVQSAYDLCEMLRIKSMGFNTILHYCYFDNNGAVDVNGTIPQLVKNANTAGLNVVVNTQNSVSHNNGTVAQVVSSADGFNNVVGYSVIDEPGSAGHSLAEQESAISVLRALTTKKLFSVDFIWRLNTWTKPWSYNYDVFLVDSYSMYYASGTLSERVNKDLGKIRTDFGAALKMTGNAKVIPCVQAYLEPSSNPTEGISGTYCFDADQACAASKVFGRAANGDFACFIWDGGFQGNLSNNTKLQAMIAELMQNAGSGQKMQTQTMIFGGVASVYQRSLHELVSKAVFKDPTNTTDSWLGGGAWPVRLRSGASETPIYTTTSGIDISGIGLRSSFSRLVTSHNALLYVTGFGVFENYGSSLSGTAALNIYTTPDGGYLENLVYSGAVTAGTPFRFSSKTSNSYDGIGEDLVIGVALSNSSDYATNYRRFIYGMFVSTNW